MKKYCSMIFRGLRLSQKKLRLTVILLCSFAALTVLTVILNPEEDLSAFPTFLSSVLLVVSGLLCNVFNEDIFESDMMSGWLKYSYCLPMTSKERSISDTLLLLINTALIFLLNVVNYLIISLILKANINTPILMLFFIVFNLSLSYRVFKATAILVSKTGAENIAKAIVKCIFITAFLIVAVMIFMENKELFTANEAEADVITIVNSMLSEIVHTLSAATIPVFILLITSNYVVSTKMYERNRLL